MKSTGIVRRIDDIGRVIIPKEIRRSMCIKEGDPLELHIDGDYICFKKYNTTERFTDALNNLTELLREEDMTACLTDEENMLLISILAVLKQKWKHASTNEDNK